MCIISLTRSKIASKTSERKTRVPNSLQPQPKKGRKKERHIIQKSSPTTFYEKTSSRTNKYRSKKGKKKAPAQWINETHRTELPSFSKLGAKTWILEELNGETCPGSKTENQKSRGPEKQKNRNYDGNWIKIHLPQKKQTKVCYCMLRTVRNLTGALVQQLLPADEVKHNPMKTRESAETAAAATPDRPTSLPKANQKAKRNVQITEEATFWLQACESVSSLCLFVCLFVPGEKRYYYCVAHSAMGCYNL